MKRITVESGSVHISQSPAEQRDLSQDYARVMTHTHTFSGKADHGGVVPPPRSYVMLSQWAKQLGIDAIGMGSPYTPTSAVTYGMYDRELNELYHSRSFDQLSVRCDDEITRMLEDANAAAGGQTLFYLDNETPKCRYGHLWWIGYHLDYPAWHDYDQPWDHWMCNVAIPADNITEPIPYMRRPYRQIVAMQRKAGSLGFWAHPTSWWWGNEGRFITNIASEMPAHAIADGYLDGMVVMGYGSWRPEYMSVWFRLLDAGFRVTGVAEEDVGLSSEDLWSRTSANTNHVFIGGNALSTSSLAEGFASGRLIATNGPLLDLAIDGKPMGSVVRTSSQTPHRVTIWLDPKGASGQLELVGRGGEIIWKQDVSHPITAKLTVSGSVDRDYLLARFVAHDLHKQRPAVIGNPVYLHPRDQGFAKPACTDLTLTIDEASPFHGGRIRFEEADGDVIDTVPLTADTLTETLPASGRFTLIDSDGNEQTEYLINANEQVMKLQRYLYRGWFRQDFPHTKPGEVPVAAWRIDEFAQVMQQIKLTR